METTPYATSIMDLIQELIEKAPNTFWLGPTETVFDRCWEMIESREGREKLEERFPDYA
jgi:hypothetical protein